MKILNRYKLIIMCLVLASVWSNTVSAQIIISEIMYDPCSGEQGSEGDCEYVELYNSYTTPFDLCGATFTGITFTFPCPAIIASSDYIIVAKNAGNCNAGTVGAEDYDLTGTIFTGFTGNLENNGGETLTLNTCGGLLIAEVTYFDDITNNDCLSLENDGTGTGTFTPQVQTPGTGSLVVGTAPAPNVYISELSYNPAGCTGNDGLCEYVVITNSGTAIVDLTGYQIQNGFTYTFPAGTMIPGGGSLSVGRNDCPNFTFDLMGGWGSTNMNNVGETVELNNGTMTINVVMYSDTNGADGDGDAQSFDECGGFAGLVAPFPAMCSVSDVVGVASCNGDNADVIITWTESMTSGTVEVSFNGGAFTAMTSGSTVTVAGPTAAMTVPIVVRDDCNNLCMATTTVDIPACPVTCTPVNTNGDVFITEIMSLPCGNHATGEFVEICNKSMTATYDIGGFSFIGRAGISNIVRHEVPAGTMLAPCLCYTSPSGAFAQTLTNGGEKVAIWDNCDNEVDVVDFESSPCATSGRNYSQSLVDWKNQDTITNNIMTNYAPSANIGDGFAGGGTPGEPNTYGACLDIPTEITATCNADFNVTFEIPYNNANNAPFSPLVLEAYDGAALLATSAPNSMASSSAVFTISGPTAALAGVVVTIQPQDGFIEQGCVQTDFILNIPECIQPECDSDNGTLINIGN